MLRGKNWIFMHLQKTGGTFLESKLKSIFLDDVVADKKKHKRARKVKAGRFRIMTIRDPLNVYFSLWSYGLDRKGAHHNRLQKELDDDTYKSIYGTNSPDCFSNFIDICYPDNQLDIYTRRILKLLIPISDDHLFDFNGKSCLSQEFYDQNISTYEPEILIPTETLNSSFHSLADSGRLAFMELPRNWKDAFPLESSEINPSKLSRSVQSGDFYINSIVTNEQREFIYKNSVVSNMLLQKAHSLLL